MLMLIYFILILFYLFYLFKSLNIGSVCCMEGVESGFHFHINYMKAECILKKILRPVLYTNKSVTLKDLLGDDETRLGSTFRVREASPLQHSWQRESDQRRKWSTGASWPATSVRPTGRPLPAALLGWTPSLHRNRGWRSPARGNSPPVLSYIPDTHTEREVNRNLPGSNITFHHLFNPGVHEVLAVPSKRRPENFSQVFSFK